MDGDAARSSPGEGRKQGNSANWLGILDVLAKLLGAVAVLAVAFAANSFQDKLAKATLDYQRLTTTITLQSQREQAESQLRADMFRTLVTPVITPVAGAQKDGGLIPPDRERLLAELLALNFHENFELKPLMEDAAQRLAPKGAYAPGAPDPREPLWSIARRIAERQKASIALEWDKASRHGCEVYLLTVGSDPDQPGTSDDPCMVSQQFAQPINLKSPDDVDTLRMVVVKPSWENQTVDVSVTPFLSSQKQPGPTSPSYRFTLTWFDLPLTDNTLLPDGNRFAVYLRIFSSNPRNVTLAVMWFPKGYFTPRERPLNYLALQELMGRKMQ